MIEKDKNKNGLILYAMALFSNDYYTIVYRRNLPTMTLY